ncbi:MAG: DUF4105 domain-containing protein [Mariniblastus sp.]|nr:DUF4105 domain-containing protein [Mariniblastus sp.]
MEFTVGNTKGRLPLLGVLIGGLLLAGCQAWQVNRLGDRILPSNQRDWSPDQQVLPHSQVSGETITLYNIRRCDYLTADDYVVGHYDQTFPVDSIETVDFIVTSPNASPSVAHTMLSFGRRDGSYLSVSIEGRTEKNEPYIPMLSISRKYEIIYVIADEADLVGAKSMQPDWSIRIYPTTATPQQSQALFLDILQRANALQSEPEFYDPLLNSNKTNLTEHFNAVQPDTLPIGWDSLLPGFSARRAHEIGLIDNRVSFESLESVADVTQLARESRATPGFSAKIRSQLDAIDRLAVGTERRAERLNRRGSQFLQQPQEAPAGKYWR